MKFIFSFLLLFLFGCSKGGGGGTSQISPKDLSSLSQELSQIREQAYQTSHSLTKADLDYLLSQNVISSEEHSELMPLAQQ